MSEKQSPALKNSFLNGKNLQSQSASGILLSVRGARQKQIALTVDMQCPLTAYMHFCAVPKDYKMNTHLRTNHVQMTVPVVFITKLAFWLIMISSTEN